MVNATHFLNKLFLIFDQYPIAYLKELQDHFVDGFKRN